LIDEDDDEVSAAVVVLHDIGDEAAGSPWRAALEAAGWPGEVVAPDLPGHGQTPAPVGGSYELADFAMWALPALASARETPPEPTLPVVVGVGVSGWAATIVALAGRASALVLVDGLGGPWADPAEVIAAGRDLLRALAEDADATAPAPARGLDPRLRHGLVRQTSSQVAKDAATAMPVPVIVIETPASTLTATERNDVLPHFASGSTLIEVSDRDPALVAKAIVSGLGDL
jgi:pimeloyl-ACP methyl ester carboxylesterase